MTRLAVFLRPYRFQALQALVLLITLVGMDLAIPRLIQRIIDQGVMRSDPMVVIWTGLLMIGISMASMGIALGNNHLSVRVGEGVARDLRDALFLKIQHLSLGNLERLKTGELMVRLFSDTAAVQRLVQVCLRIGTRAPLLMAGSLILMVKTSPYLALTIFPLVLVTLGIIVLFTVRMEPLFGRVQEKFDRLNTVLQENVAGVRLVRAFVREAHETDRFSVANTAFTRDSIQVSQVLALISPLLTLCVNLGVVALIWVGGIHSVQGKLSIGQIMAFTNYLLTTMGPLLMLGRLSNVWAGGTASLSRLNHLLDTQPIVSERPGAQVLLAGAPGLIRFEKVGFSYDPGQAEPVLTDIDLVIHPGETLAVLGATGAGKSTLVNLIPRFYDVTEGRVTLDGTDIRDFTLDSLMAAVAMVPQETILFSGSIRENIAYACPGIGLSDIEAAARAAVAHDFILALPRGYETHVAERGVNLSGGQKQRIAIARALAARTRILILDDSTSAVDARTETMIHQAMDALVPRPTRIMVAQRISTVLKADRILVMDQGRVLAIGSHLDLMGSCKVYREIFDSQLGDGPARAGDLR